MKNKIDYLKELDIIENTFSDLINAKLAGFNDEDRVFAVKLINDSVDLIKDIVRDCYMFDVSYNNYNNGFSFMPQYYFENILLHDDMLWERIIMIIALTYQIDFEVIFEKKGIGPLYDIVKKDDRVAMNIKTLLFEINSDHAMKTLKNTRNGNEHYISSHLEKKEERKAKIEDFVYIESGKLYGDLAKINDQTERVNREEMQLLKKNIVVVSRKQEKYSKLLKLCIIQIEDVFKSETFLFNQKMHFLPDFNKELYLDEDSWSRCKELDNKYASLRDDFKIVVDMINKNVFLAMDSRAMIRNTLLVDSIFRAKEIIRSVDLYFLCAYHFSDQNDFDPEQKFDFEKYCCNEMISPYYYYEHAIIKLYSVYEKLAKFLLCKYDFDGNYLEDVKFKGMYIDRVKELFNRSGLRTEIILKFCNCVSSIEYKEYEKARNMEYHCLRTLYVFEQNSSEMGMNVTANVCNIVHAMDALYNLFSMIIQDEEKIYEQLICNINIK